MQLGDISAIGGALDELIMLQGGRGARTPAEPYRDIHTPGQVDAGRYGGEHGRSHYHVLLRALESPCAASRRSSATNWLERGAANAYTLN